MKISKKLGLNRTQMELDFIDIDLSGDTPLFIDPYFLSIRTDPWSVSVTQTIRSFFQKFLDLMKMGKEKDALELFGYLGEPNETRLGLSKGAPQGRGVGAGDSLKIFESLRKSKAVSTGLVENMEDCRLFIEGIDRDKISDMATNIIRHHLVDYTKSQCDLWGIAMQENVPTGFFWDRSSGAWHNDRNSALIIDGSRILLVPKSGVSYSARYTSQAYYQHFVLNFLQEDHLKRNSFLVERSYDKKGRLRREFVTKKSVKEHNPLTKEFLVDFTEKHPQVFQKFKDEIKRGMSSATENENSTDLIQSVADKLKSHLLAIQPGNEGASRYHSTVLAILELVFFPRLTCPVKEKEIHNGRKRIDLIYDNSATDGFFYNLHTIHHLPCSYLMVECKNYSRKVANPELDQLAGRFSPNRGQVGLLLCRTIDDIDQFYHRCHDTFVDQRGLIIPLTDDDLVSLLEEVRSGKSSSGDALLADRMRRIRLL